MEVSRGARVHVELCEGSSPEQLVLRGQGLLLSPSVGITAADALASRSQGLELYVRPKDPDLGAPVRILKLFPPSRGIVPFALESPVAWQLPEPPPSLVALASDRPWGTFAPTPEGLLFATRGRIPSWSEKGVLRLPRGRPARQGELGLELIGAPVWVDSEIGGLIVALRDKDLAVLPLLEYLADHEALHSLAHRLPPEYREVIKGGAAEGDEPTSSAEQKAPSEPAAEEASAESADPPTVGMDDLGNSVASALARAKSVADAAGTPVDVRALLGGIVEHAGRPGFTDFALFLSGYLATHGPFGDPVGALERLGLDLKQPLSSSGLAAVPTSVEDDVLDVLDRARVLVARTGTGRRVRMRHLIAAALFPTEPGRPAPGGELLRERGFDTDELRERFLDAVRKHVPGEEGAWTEVLRPIEVETGAPASVLAGYVPDSTDGADRLDIRRDVETLCHVIAAEACRPPLSIGLFGDWGMGKSFFMGKMREHVAELCAQSARARARGLETAFVPHVAQIEFNAWHFVDASLWASLVTRIFEGLVEELLPHAARRREAEVERARAQLFGELETTRRQAAEARSEREVARRQQRAARRELDALQRRGAKLQGRLRDVLDLGSRAAFDLLRREDGHLDQELDEVAETLGVERGDLSLDRLARVRTRYRRLAPRLARAFERVREDPRSLLVALPALALGLVAGLRATGRLPEGLESLFAFAEDGLTWVVTIPATVAGALGPQLGRIGRGLDLLEDVQERARELGGREARQLEERLREHVAAARAAQERLAGHEARVAELEAELARIERGRQLEPFLHERIASADYTEQLGIIAVVRRDFEELGRRLARGIRRPSPDGEGDGEGDGEPELVHVDRVVLYVDDLDRCPPERVVDVLQAVHLLLAIPYFVVVVAVDPRWLLHSLHKHFRDVLTSPGGGLGIPVEEAGAWRTTPQNYLEKIFQIPFTLPPMSRKGYVRLVRSLFEPDGAPTGEPGGELRVEPGAPAGDERAGGTADVAVPTTDAHADEAVADTPQEQPEPVHGAGAGAEPEAEDEDAGEAERAAGGPGGDPGPGDGAADDDWTPSLDLMPRALEVPEHEREFLEGLEAMIRTPRSAKRLVNVYRLVRAGLDDDELAAFEGTREAGGEHQAVQLLLGILIGFPALAPDVFRGLRRTHETDFWAFLERDLRPALAGTSHASSVRQSLDAGERREVERMLRELRTLEPDVAATNTTDVFRRWSVRVARYSFRARYLASARAALPPEVAAAEAAGPAPADDALPKDARADDVPPEDARADDVPSEDARADDVPPEDAPADDAPAADDGDATT